MAMYELSDRERDLLIKVLADRLKPLPQQDCKIVEFNNYVQMMPAINTKLAEGYELVGPVQVVTSQDGLPRYVATMIR